MARPRLLATDLDGTFLDSRGRISSENEAAFRRAADEGVHLVVATGRPWRWLSVLEPLHDLDLHVLASNGAVRYDLADDRVTSHDPMDVEVIREVVDDLRGAVPGLGFALEHVDGWSCDEAYTVDHHEVEPVPFVGPIEEGLQRAPAVKLLVRSQTIASDALADLITPVVGDRLNPTWSFVVAKGLIEISSPGISKASGLRRLMDDLSVSPDDSAAFGDMPNDIAMLQMVGRPFAMANAHPSVLDLGFPVAGHHDESGVGRTVQALLD
ncbi:HAD family hydrolase [Aestuariimicrobium ganziense]|uniref:HAD family hydrolase n=1 Tax=Aestuariimicrobium ganziense TaxID=2773677 RepID=UPI001945AA18|nr:HAD family hydrolase [Aestuariimicrobium ganziense]